ncbi:ABC transporter permease subunit [Nocardia sp. NBC_01503]|uniref:ABC transporter permease n=1 Tax=Nocardia sp. NBC_01503 TaxID=2975997 RepID=UPI002E7C2169|nr:ABC transporter permease subunit [Nocardia sp. NBC_01503]WTL30744.1 ABC transporter permease subunit [Nocardia sp. NBC_01503]
MATVTDPTVVLGGTAGQQHPPSVRTYTRPRAYWRWIVLGLAALYFIGPFAVAFWFTIHDKNGVSFRAYRRILSTAGLSDALGTSLALGLIAVVVTLVLMVPTMLLVHLRLQSARPVVELLSLLPLVIPPVALVVGVRSVLSWGNNSDYVEISQVFTALQQQPLSLILALVYVVIALPFTFRALDAGIRGSRIEVLVEAAQNLGAGWFTVLWRVVLPALRTSILNAAFLTFALVMGEYTIAKILIFRTFPVWLAQSANTDGQLQVALSILSLVLTWLILLIVVSIAGRSRKASR